MSDASNLAHISQSLLYSWVITLLLCCLHMSCFMKVLYLLYRFKLMAFPKSKPIHNLFHKLCPISIQFQSISISIWISTPLKGSSHHVLMNPSYSRNTRVYPSGSFAATVFSPGPCRGKPHVASHTGYPLIFFRLPTDFLAKNSN